MTMTWEKKNVLSWHAKSQHAAQSKSLLAMKPTRKNNSADKIRHRAFGTLGRVGVEIAFTIVVFLKIILKLQI